MQCFNHTKIKYKIVPAASGHLNPATANELQIDDR